MLRLKDCPARRSFPDERIRELPSERQEDLYADHWRSNVRALLIRPAPLGQILEGTKTWEIRGSKTLVRETIGLIASGSGTVVGVCDLVDCVGPLSAEQY